MKATIAKLLERKSLTADEAAAAMRLIMGGEATGAQIGAFLVALRMKGETVEEIAGCARVMRQFATRIRAPEDVIDTCGTGGDSKGTFNISTAAALVAAGAGVSVAKHGNRAVSSSSGSADVLAELGVRIDAPVETVERCLAQAGIGFLFAPMLHGAMKHAIGPRREIGARTIFNILGPLTNPAGASAQLLGVWDPRLCRTLAEVLGELGSRRAWVVSSADGMDEISTAAPTHVARLEGGEVTEVDFVTAGFGLRPVAVERLKVAGVAESAAKIRAVLAGDDVPERDVVLANAAAAIHVGGEAADFAAGLRKAEESVDSGAAAEALKGMVEITAPQG